MKLNKCTITAGVIIGSLSVYGAYEAYRNINITYQEGGAAVQHVADAGFPKYPPVKIIASRSPYNQQLDMVQADIDANAALERAHKERY